jgi:hypothetical protein
MPLSINKLEKLLIGKGLLPKKFFTVDGLCVYLEVLNISNAESFMLYIPSKYEIQIHSGENVYKIEYLDITDDGNIPGDYAGEPDNFELERQYEEIDIDLDLNSKKGQDMAEHLEENYNHPLSLKDISKNDTVQLREIFRQLRRLRFCVQNLKYKLCILFKDYLCCIRRDDTFEGFLVQHLRGPMEKKLMVAIDLESLYEKFESLSIDLKIIREGVYRVLDKNQDKHIRNLQKMLEHKNDLVILSNNVTQKKTKYSQHLTRLEQLLTDLNAAEKLVLEKLLSIESRYNAETSLKGLHTDIEKSHQISKQESELSKINAIKQELIHNILIVKTKHENLSLKIDSIVFDSNVMVDAILRNLVKLSEV